MKKVLNILKNKYVIAILVFIIWTGFIDNNNLILSLKTRKNIKELQKSKDYYLKEIENTNRIKNELINNRKSFEKFARETYYLKRPTEEVIIVEMVD